MSITYINGLGKVSMPKMSLCKPNKQVISPLNDVYGIELNMRMGAISELSFTIPSKVERNHQLVDNPLITKIKDRYFLKLVYENQTEFFVFLNENKIISSDGKNIIYKLFSAGILLADKIVRDFEETSLSLYEFANEFLKETSWRVTTVDGSFNKRRYMQISSATVLQCLFDLAENFNAVILFDTLKEEVKFFKPENLGLSKGLKIKEGRFLQSLDIERRADEMVTRLYAYGRDGLEFRSLMSTGENYIEDFSYFMYGFKCDDNYNVLSSSEYMSDELCVAITKYRKLLASFDGRFGTYTAALTASKAMITSQETILTSLATQLKVLLNERDLINATYGDQAAIRQDHIDVLARIEAKRAEIQAKTTQITQLNNEKKALEDNIAALKTNVSMENNFSPALLMELNKYIIYKEYTNESITEPEDLFQEATEIFETLNEPPINVSISVEGYLESLQDKTQPQKISLGDVIRVEDKELNISYRLKILEMLIDFDELNVTLTIANGKDVIDDNAKLVKIIYDSSNTSTTVNMDKFKWNQAVTTTDSVSRLLNSEWDAVKNAIMGGYNQTITISERGLIAQDVTDPMNWLVLQNGVLAITNDNGNTWKTAITKNGIFAERLVGRILIGNKLLIEDDEGIITITGGAQTIYDPSENEKVVLGRYKDQNDNYKYGIKINSGAIEISDGLPKSQIEKSAVDLWDNAEINAKAYSDALKRQLQGEISDVIGELGEFQQEIETTFKDGIIEESEAISIGNYVNNLTKEKLDLDRRYNIIVNDVDLIGTPKTELTSAKTTFNSAHDNLIQKINEAIADGRTTQAEKTAVDASFTAYSNALTTLSEKLQLAVNSIETKKITKVEDNFQTYAQSIIVPLQAEMADITERIDELDDYIGDAFADGIISQAEAKAIGTYLNNIAKEKADVDAQYDYISSISYLPSANKSTLATVKNTFNTAYSSLVTAINNAISDGKTTATEKSDVDNRFVNYRTASASLYSTFQTCVDVIAHARVSEMNSGIRGDLRLTAPLPTSLTLDTNGITAQTSTASNFARLDYRGLYVQGGAVDIRTSSSLNAGVLLNGTGIKGYNSSGTQTFDVNAATGRVTISGSFTIQSSGANNGSIRISESGIVAYDYSGTQTFSLNSNGSAHFSGTVSSSTISGGTVSGTNISGGTITGAAISGSTITGATIQTSTYANTGLKLDANGLSLYNGAGSRIVYLSGNGTASFSGTITGSTIESSTINVNTDAYVGDTLTIGNGSSYATKTLTFRTGRYGSASLAFIDSSEVLQLNSSGTIDIRGLYGVTFSGGIIDFSNASSINWGNKAPNTTAVFG